MLLQTCNRVKRLNKQTTPLKDKVATAIPKSTYRDISTQTLGRYKTVKAPVKYVSSAVQTSSSIESALQDLQAPPPVCQATSTTSDDKVLPDPPMTETPSSPPSLITEALPTLSPSTVSTACEIPPSPEPETLQLLLEDSLCAAELRAWERGIVSARTPEEQHHYTKMLKAEICERGIAGMEKEMLEGVMRSYS